MSQNFARAYTTCYSSEGLQEIEVQVLIRKGLPRFDIIGLPQNMVREGKDRILACLHQLGIELPTEKVLVYLKPGDISKEGSHLDLAILAAILQGLGLLRQTDSKNFYWGELELDSGVRSVPSALGHMLLAKNSQAKSIHLGPLEKELHGIEKFLDLPLNICRKAEDLLNPPPPQSSRAEPELSITDMWRNPTHESRWNKLRGSSDQFLFWSLASLGRWNLLLNGSPGVGKSSWCFASSELQRPLPPEDWAKKFEFSPLPAQRNWGLEELSKRPFEAPHHTSSASAVVGGGHLKLVPGAITRAHKGILFLDELPEFQRNVLEALREPLEEKVLSISRRGCVKHFPADIQLLAAMNPCRCGKFSSSKKCVCSSTQYWTYQAKLSEPLKDRFHRFVWWSFVDQPQTSEFHLKNIRHRLLEAESRKPKLKQLDLSNISNPRQQKLWLEMLVTWAKFFDCSEIGPRENEAFTNFISKIKESPE